MEQWERSIMHRVTARYGFKATFLWLIAIAWSFQAVVVVLAEPVWIANLFHTHIPTPIRFCLWAIPATVAMILSRSFEKQWLGFVLLGLAPAQRLTSYTIGAPIEITTGHYSTGWEYVGRALIWLLVILVIWLASVWPDPPDGLARPEIDEEGSPDHQERAE
jgi:hypothetical protein